jgi:ribonuclease III
MSELVVIFSTQSPIEADVVRGLLETHGIDAVIRSSMPLTSFPMSVHELRVTVKEEDAARAQRIIESHRDDRAPDDASGDAFGPLEAVIGYSFRDRGLLEHALTHRSRVHEDASGGVFDNESLEFLGDSILGFIIADMLFREFPHHNEGQKSKLRASIVSAASLARLGEKIDLGSFLILGRGEEKTGGRRKHALIADSYEALIAAIYLDGGIEPAREFVERQFGEIIDEARRSGAGAAFTEDYKSALQEWLQAAKLPQPRYLVVQEKGPQHHKTFTIEVRIGNEYSVQAEGPAKKAAEQEAARLALEHFRRQPETPPEEAAAKGADE